MHKIPRLTRSRHGVYYLRLTHGKTDTRRSLGTKDFQRAKLSALLLNVHVEMSKSRLDAEMFRHLDIALPNGVTRYDLSIGDASFSSLPKRRLIYEIVAEALRQRVPLTGIAKAVPWRGNVFATADGQLDEAAFQTVLGTKRLRYFTADDDLFHVDGNTYALSNQWGARTLEAIENILRLMPNKELVSYSPATALTDEVVHGEYLIRQCESGAIEVEQDGTQVQPVKPVLRKLAEQLGVPLQNANGNNLNTRQLGVQVMNAIRSQ